MRLAGVRTVLLFLSVTLAARTPAHGQSQIVGWGAPGPIPTAPAGLSFVELSAGGSHCLARLSDGSVLAWGNNSSGQCNVPPLPTGVSYVEIAAGGGHSLARRSDGSVLAWGYNFYGQCNVPSLPSGVTCVQIAAGDSHSVARLSDGSVVAWGSNQFGQCNVPVLPIGLTYAAIATSSLHTVALRSDGSAVAWGWNANGQCNVPALPTGLAYVEVTAGAVHTVARRSDGSVVAWGSNYFGQCNVPALPRGLTCLQIAAAGDFGVPGPNGQGGHAIARRSDGRVVAWGSNYQGPADLPVPSGFTCVRVAANSGYSVALLAEADCNGNGIRDDLDIQAAFSGDCDGNGVPDECDLLLGTFADCDGNGLIDSCELAANPSLDLNLDGRLDSCPLLFQPYWQTNIGGYAGIDGAIKSMIVFDDGSGPALYCGGNFQSAGGVAANCVAKWDGVGWAPLASGLGGGEVRSFAIFDEGSGPRLIAAGSFTSTGSGVPANGIARWDGAAWAAVGTGYAWSIRSIAVYDSGSGPELYADGQYKWNGTSWMVDLQFPQGFRRVWSSAVHDDGTGPALYAGGTQWGGGGIARFDGANWTSIGGPGEIVASLASYDDGTGLALFAGAVSYNQGPLKWNGSTWSPLGGGLAAVPGSAGGGINQYSLTTFDDGSGPALYAGGTFLTAETNRVDNIARWNGVHWSAVGSGCNGDVYCMCPFDDGRGARLYVGGLFTAVGGVSANGIASWGLPGGCVPTGTVICEPGTNGVNTCPCSNPPTGAGRGCNNSSGTGGARITTTGFARLGTDNLVFTTSGEKPGASSLVLQGTASSATGLIFGQGVRCVSGSLKRLYLKQAIAGSITAPGAGDPSVSARSAALGSPIAPGMHRCYGVYYRDPIILGGCPASSGFNITQQLDVLWHP